MRRVIRIPKKPGYGIPQRCVSHYNFVVAGGGWLQCVVVGGGGLMITDDWRLLFYGV